MDMTTYRRTGWIDHGTWKRKRVNQLFIKVKVYAKNSLEYESLSNPSSQITVSMVSRGFYIEGDVGYVGVKEVLDSFYWGNSINVHEGSPNSTPVVRIVDKGGHLITVSLGYNAVWDWEITCFDNVRIISKAILAYQDEYYYSLALFWESLCVSNSGIFIVIVTTIANGVQLRRSTDYGITWSDLYAVDCLQTMLGSNYFHWTSGDHLVFAGSLQTDKHTGTFWLAVTYWDHNLSRLHSVIAYSSNGLTWTFVKDIDIDKVDSRRYTLAVFNETICSVYQDSINDIRVYYSSDSGSNWTDSVPTKGIFTYYRKPVVALNDRVVIIQVENDTGMSILRSTDGINWATVLTVYDPLEMGYPSFPSLRTDGGYFVSAFCWLRSPMDGVTYKGTDEVIHSLSGDGISYLGFFMSEDNGMTWNFEKTTTKATFEAVEGEPDPDGHWQQGLDINVPPGIPPKGAKGAIVEASVIPHLMLRWRDDGNPVWSLPMEIELTPDYQGDFIVPLNRMGTYRSRQYEFKMSPNGNMVLVGATEDIEVLKN